MDQTNSANSEMCFDEFQNREYKGQQIICQYDKLKITFSIAYQTMIQKFWKFESYMQSTISSFVLQKQKIYGAYPQFWKKPASLFIYILLWVIIHCKPVGICVVEIEHWELTLYNSPLLV